MACEMRLPTRRLRDKTQAAYDEGRDVLWFASRPAEIRRGIDSLAGWRPARLGVYTDGERRFAWLAHDASTPVAYFTTPTSWLRSCRRCDWTDEAWAWSEPDERVAHHQAGAFACGASGCISRAHGWTSAKGASRATRG